MATSDTGSRLLADSVVLYGCAVAALGLYSALPRLRVESLVLAASFATVATYLTFAAGMATDDVRPLAALVLLVIAGMTAFAGRYMRRWGRPISPHSSDGELRVSLLVSGALVGVAVGFLVAPWTGELWPLWRGALAGTAFVVLMVVAGLVARRIPDLAPESQTSWWGVLELTTMVAAFGTLVMAASADPASSVAIQRVIGIALILTGCGLLGLALLTRLPAWTAWLAALAFISSALLIVDFDQIREVIRPEAYSLLLAIPAAVAGIAWWWLHRPDASSSWITVAPAVTLALLPPTISILDDATSRWWEAVQPGSDYQVRMVVLLAVGVVLAIVGVRQRIAGVLFPGVAVILAIAAIELVDLGRSLPQWVSFAIAGVLLVAAGARWEAVRKLGREGSAWAHNLR